MPFYEYECTECGSRFEQRNTMGSRHTATCPNCGGLAGLLISLSNFYMEQPVTVRRSDGSIFDQKPRGGAIPEPRRPTPEERDRAQASL